MIFTTYTYGLFLGITFALHWMAPKKVRPWLLIGASYFFYATWRWPYLILLVAVTLFNWAYGRFYLRHDRDGALWPGILVNLSVLLYFKYLDFSLQSMAALGRALGVDWTPEPFDIALPLGVSFFVFQGIAYLVDVATGEEPFIRLRDFMLYKAFWPQLIAGPIVRPGEIREQIENPGSLTYENVAEGGKRILQGAFKKVVLADSLGPHVDLAFLRDGQPHALDTIAGVVGFGFQVYFDFSAYSDFAIGSARLFGFRFPENFDWPYAARSPQDFWNRWHMSLSRWIRDYIFTPLSFAFRSHPKLRVLWLVLAMALCGLWHGASWTFILWGLWHGAMLVLQQTLARPMFSSAKTSAVALGWLLTMAMVFAGWLLFRSSDLATVAGHLKALATLRGGLRPALIRENGVLVIGLISLSSIGVTLCRASIGRVWARIVESPSTLFWVRPAFYALLLAATIVLDQEARAFVYFQF